MILMGMRKLNKISEKKKVGRPKLADKKLKKESIFVCIFVISITMIVGYLGFKVLTIDFNPKYIVANVNNNHVNSCVIENNKIDCGPNVIYMKYKIGNSDYIEFNKSDKSIEINIENYKDINVCYKTNKTDLICKTFK